MTTPAPSRVPVLVVVSRARSCALPLKDVIEVMRPLPEEPIPGPPFLRGVAIVRGAPVPVLDLAVLLGTWPSDAVGRFVTLRAGSRQIALAVDEVRGKLDIDSRLFTTLPSLLGETSSDLVSAVGAVDGRLLTSLQASRVLLDEVWQAVNRAGAAG